MQQNVYFKDNRFKHINFLLSYSVCNLHEENVSVSIVIINLNFKLITNHFIKILSGFLLQFIIIYILSFNFPHKRCVERERSCARSGRHQCHYPDSLRYYLQD